MINFFNKNGYVIVNLYDQKNFKKIKKFSERWLQSVINYYLKKKINYKEYKLENYHKWFRILKLDQSKIFQNTNRVIEPGIVIKNLIFTKKLDFIVSKLLNKKYEMWRDPGLGYLCYRFIRPGYNDGYHLCKKSWGQANKVLSAWLPVIGFDQNLMLQILPSSHKKNLPFLKKIKKFAEPKVNLKYVNAKKLLRPILKPGQILFYHPDLLHSENISNSDSCRMNLEFRFNPIR